MLSQAERERILGWAYYWLRSAALTNTKSMYCDIEPVCCDDIAKVWLLIRLISRSESVFVQEVCREETETIVVEGTPAIGSFTFVNQPKNLDTDNSRIFGVQSTKIFWDSSISTPNYSQIISDLPIGNTLEDTALIFANWLNWYFQNNPTNEPNGVNLVASASGATVTVETTAGTTWFNGLNQNNFRIIDQRLWFGNNSTQSYFLDGGTDTTSETITVEVCEDEPTYEIDELYRRLQCLIDLNTDAESPCGCPAPPSPLPPNPVNPCECVDECTIDQETCVWRVEGIELRPTICMTFPDSLTPVADVAAYSGGFLLGFGGYGEFTPNYFLLSYFNLLESYTFNDLAQQFIDNWLQDASDYEDNISYSIDYEGRTICIHIEEYPDGGIEGSLTGSIFPIVVTGSTLIVRDSGFVENICQEHTILTNGQFVNPQQGNAIDNNVCDSEQIEEQYLLPLSLSFQIFRNGTWTTVTPTDGVYESAEEFTAWRIIDSEANVIEEGEPEVVCTGEPVTKTICNWIEDHESRIKELEENQSGTQVQSDWDETDTDSPAYIQNKPTIPTVPTVVSAFTNDAGYQTAAQLSTAILPLLPLASYLGAAGHTGDQLETIVLTFTIQPAQWLPKAMYQVIADCNRIAQTPTYRIYLNTAPVIAGGILIFQASGAVSVNAFRHFMVDGTSISHTDGVGTTATDINSGNNATRVLSSLDRSVPIFVICTIQGNVAAANGEFLNIQIGLV